MPQPATVPIQIIHYNDVYNIDVSPREPVGGAARFITAIRKAIIAHDGPSFVLFSGDAFSPAPLTALTEGAEMPPVLNATAIDVACIGNHELDRGIEVMKARIAETNFPWLCSNVKEKDTGLPIGAIHEYCVLERAGYKFGFMGLASYDWLSTLVKVDPEELEYEDFVAAADRLSTLLRRELECDYIVALTHMREPDDDKLAREARDIDLVLGGHDHVLSKKYINGRYVLKSGTDFKNFSTVEIVVDDNWALCASEPVHHDVTSDIREDPFFAKYAVEQLGMLGSDYKRILGISTVDLDGRFLSIRTQETALGSFIADVMASYMNTKIALINAGSIRSDCIEPPGKVTQQTINAILPFRDTALVAEYTGQELLNILENSVSQYPLLDGRFLQVSGVFFKFDPQLPAGKRIHPGDVLCKQMDDSLRQIEDDGIYHVAVKTFIHLGKDGYPEGCNSKIIKQSETTIANMVSKHLSAESETDIPTLSPESEGRVICLHPDQELVQAYRYVN